MSGLNRNNGFTLLELLVTIAIMVIVLGIAVPAFRPMILENRVSSQTNQVSSLVRYARSEATKMTDGGVTLCASNDGETCSGSSSWEDGWIVFSDQDFDGVVDAGADEVIQIGRELTGDNTLRIVGFSSNGTSFIKFTRGGRPEPVPPGVASTPSGTLVLCDSRGADKAKAIVVNITGQTRLARDADDNDIPEDHAGNDIACP